MNLFIILWIWIRCMIVACLTSLRGSTGKRQSQKLFLRPWRRQLVVPHHRFRACPKPKWVRTDVIRLKALRPQRAVEPLRIISIDDGNPGNR